VLKVLDSSASETDSAINFNFLDYIELVDLTDLAIDGVKRNYIFKHFAPILCRINIDPEKWFEMMQPKQIHRAVVLGCPEKLAEYATAHQLLYIRGSPKVCEMYLH